jgi:hypothetical protein
MIFQALALELSHPSPVKVRIDFYSIGTTLNLIILNMACMSD